MAVLSTMVSPWRTTTAPEACLAILPGLEGDLGARDLDGDRRHGVICSCVDFLSLARPSVGGPMLSCIFVVRTAPHRSLIRASSAYARRGRRGPRRSAVAHVAARPAAATSGSRRSASKRSRSRPSASHRAHRCGSSMRPWSAYSASWNGPERALARRPPRARGPARRARGCLARSAKWRKATRTGARCRRVRGDGAARAREVRVEDDERRAAGAADVVVGAQRRDGGAGRQVASSCATRPVPDGDAHPRLRREQVPRPARPRRSSRSSPMPATSRRSRRRCCASRS